MTMYTLRILDFQKHLFLCKYIVVQYGVGLPGAFFLFADHLGCTEVVRTYEGLAFINKNSDYCHPMKLECHCR